MSKLIKSRFSSKQTESAAIVPIMKMEDTHFHAEVMEESEQITHAKRLSEQIIRTARAEEESLRQSIKMAKQNWEQERLALEEEARESGYQEGLAYGRQDGYQQVSEAIRQANQLVELSRADYLEKVESGEETIVALAVKMAEKIIGTSLNEQPDQMIDIVKALLKEVKDYDEIKVFVHPERYEYVRSQKTELKQLLTNEQELFLYMDDSLSPFDCFVETSFGRIDASVDTQLKQLEKQLLERLGEAETS